MLALCVTCLVDQVMPEIGVAAVRLLRRAGFEVAFPEGQTCCGQPFFNSGFHDEARELAKRTIPLFEPYQFVVLPSGSCAAMMRIEYPHLLADDPQWHARAQILAKKVYELSEFLTQFAPTWEPKEELSPLTYHDSCHMCRLLGVRDQPRQQLQQAGYPIQEMAEADRCCGFGGLFSARLPEVANAMSGEKLRQAQASGAAVLATADPGCLLQLRGLSASARGMRLEHIAILLEEATR